MSKIQYIITISVLILISEMFFSYRIFSIISHYGTCPQRGHHCFPVFWSALFYFNSFDDLFHGSCILLCKLMLIDNLIILV